MQQQMVQMLLHPGSKQRTAGAVGLRTHPIGRPVWVSMALSVGALGSETSVARPLLGQCPLSLLSRLYEAHSSAAGSAELLKELSKCSEHRLQPHWLIQALLVSPPWPASACEGRLRTLRCRV